MTDTSPPDLARPDLARPDLARPDLARPDVRRFLDYLNALPGPRTHEMTAPEARAVTARSRPLVEVERGPMAIVRDLTVAGPAGPIPCRLYDPQAGRPPGPVVLFFHGGGFVLGDLESHDAACAAIARGLDLSLLAVDYRLAPEHRWPAAPDDCEAVARAVAAGAVEGLRPTGLVLAGDSAGGNLAIVTAMALRDTPAALPVLAQWPIYPATDMVTPTDSFLEYAEGYFLSRQGASWFSDAYRADPAHPRGSPGLSDQAGMPPTLVVTAQLDPLRDQGRAYAASLIRAGVPTIYREALGTVHGFLTMRRAMPSGEGDLQGCLAVLKPMIAEAEAARVMAAAA